MRTDRASCKLSLVPLLQQLTSVIAACGVGLCLLWEAFSVVDFGKFVPSGCPAVELVERHT